MTTIIDGNANNLSVSDDSSNGDTIILGNGIDDTVSANSSSYDAITLGNGAGDTASVPLVKNILGLWCVAYGGGA